MNTSVKREKAAVDYFAKGFSCSQAVFTPHAKGAGVDEKTAFRLSSGLGGGCGHQGLTCGVVTGAYLAIGLKYGRTKADDLAAKEKTYTLVREFSRRFKRRNKSINCTELLGCDMSTPEGMRRAQKEGLPKIKCPKFVQDAAEILEELLANG